MDQGVTLRHGPERGDEEARLREEGDRLERLLAEIPGMAGPATWARVEELVQRLVGLYGAGLARALACARAAGVPGAPFDAELRGDPLLSSLLTLHGLHPAPVAERVERALEEVRPRLGAHAGGVELLGIDEGVVRLRLVGSCRACPSSAAALESTLRCAIEEAAPEVSAVRIETEQPPARLVVLRAGA